MMVVERVKLLFGGLCLQSTTHTVMEEKNNFIHPTAVIKPFAKKNVKVAATSRDM